MSVKEGNSGKGGSAGAAPAWESSSTVAELAAWLATKRRIVILTHVKPDGDAVGSTIALARALVMAGSQRGWGSVSATPWYFGALPDWVPGVTRKTETRFVDQTHRPEDHTRGAAGGEPDAVVVLDTGSWTQVQEVEPWLRERAAIIAVIDHHRQGNPDMSPRRVVDVHAAAACEPVAELCWRLLALAGPADLPVDIAEPLYLGLATDTGWFRHSNVTPGAMRLAADLIQAGVDHPKLYEMIEQRDRTSRLRLLARALGSLDLLDHERIAVMTLTQKDFHECHAASTDSAGFADVPLSTASVMVSVLMTEAFVAEPTGGSPAKVITKVSMRSKSGPGGMDVGSVAASLGGGGHVPAAGVKMAVGIAEAKKLVTAALLKASK